MQLLQKATLDRKEKDMAANLEYDDYYLTDNGWIEGDSKIIGEPVRKAVSPANIKDTAYMHIREYSEFRAIGQSSGIWIDTQWRREGCEEKIKELLEKYPKGNLR